MSRTRQSRKPEMGCFNVQVVGRNATWKVTYPKTGLSIEKSDAFLGSKITFGEIAKNLVNYGEFSESGRFRKKCQKGDETPTQYRSNAHFGTFQKLQKRSMIYPSEMHLQSSTFWRNFHSM